MNTDGFGGKGFGVSLQLYGLLAQLPPPMDRGSWAGRWPPPPGGCA
jgi:hypothetical protein